MIEGKRERDRQREQEKGRKIEKEKEMRKVGGVVDVSSFVTAKMMIMTNVSQSVMQFSPFIIVIAVVVEGEGESKSFAKRDNLFTKFSPVMARFDEASLLLPRVTLPNG